MKKSKLIIYTVGTIILLLSFFLAISWGSYSMSLREIIDTLMGNGTALQSVTIWDIRLPRICVAILVASCLSVASIILQSVTRNELAEPGMIGINAGAALAVVLLISHGQTNYYSTIGDATLYIMPIVSCIGAMISGSIIYRLSDKNGVSPTRLLLTGIGMNVGVNAFISLYQLNMSRGDYNQVLVWTSGSLWGSSWKFFFLILVPVLFVIGFAVYSSKKMDVMDLGDEISIGLGLAIEKERKKLFFAAIILSALATAVAGNIAFLGLLGSQIARKIVGPVHRIQIPMAILISTCIILVADALSRNVFSPIEIPVGITISIVGVPYFIYLILRDK